MADSQILPPRSSRYDLISQPPQASGGPLDRDSYPVRRKPVPQRPIEHAYDGGEHDDTQSEELLAKDYPSTRVQVRDMDSTRIAGDKTRPSRIPRWPAEPRRLDKTGGLFYSGMAWGVFATLVPVVFIVLGFCALSLDQKPRSSFGNSVVEGLRLGPSIFPIIYAAIVGRMMRSVAQWVAERGTQLGLLEQLVGSQSVFSSTERLLMLERYGPSSLAIVLLWLISPLGGQSSFRILDLAPSTEQSQGTVSYLDVNITGTSDFGEGDIDTAAAITGIFQASLLAAPVVQVSPVDVWNNVKVPMVDELSPWSPEDPENPWITVQTGSSNGPYAALTGLNLGGVPNTGKSQFNLETSYMQLQCADGKSFPPTEVTISGSQGIAYDYAFPYGLQLHNASDPFLYVPFDSPDSDTQYTSYFFDSDSETGYAGQTGVLSQFNILYGTKDTVASNNDMILFNCSIRTRHVEAGVTCEGSACLVDKVRRSTLPDTSDTQLTPFFNQGSFTNMIRFLGSVTGVPNPGQSAPLDYYIRGSTYPFAQIQSTTNINDVSATDASRRLSALLNTAWQIALAPLSVSQGSAAAWGYTFDEVFQPGQPRLYFAKITPAVFTTNGPDRYTADKPFLVIFLLTAILLQTCAVVGLVFKLLCKSPDILGYVSTQTRDNLLFPDLIGGTTLGGLERARLLSKLKVQVGDVRPLDDVGHIALREVERVGEPGVREARVRKDRHYE